MPIKPLELREGQRGYWERERETAAGRRGPRCIINMIFIKLNTEIAKKNNKENKRKKHFCLV